MNKYKVILDMLKDKILFLFERYDHNNNKISTLKDLSFLPNASFIIITRPFKSIVENDSNEDNFDMNHFKDVFNRKRLTLLRLLLCGILIDSKKQFWKLIRSTMSTGEYCHNMMIRAYYIQ